MSELSHLDEEGRARMVDVSGKPATVRTARARATVRLKPETIGRLASGALPKGDALEAARLAGILAAKRTSELIPLCHPLPLDWVEVRITLLEAEVRVEAEVKTRAPTGPEMEALTAAAVAALTLYDMVKAVEPEAVISEVCVCEKTGGKSGRWSREEVQR